MTAILYIYLLSTDYVRADEPPRRAGRWGDYPVSVIPASASVVRVDTMRILGNAIGNMTGMISTVCCGKPYITVWMA